MTKKANVGSTIKLTYKESLENAIIKENTKKYHQTESSCPLFHPSIYNQIGSIGDGPAASDILNRTFEPPEVISQSTKDFLTYVQKSSSIQDLSIEECLMSLQDFKTRWRNVKERTSSIGPHIGHYKAATQHDGLSRLFHLKSEIPLLGEFAPSSYKKGLDVMILKKVNSTDIDKLRTVVLFESEANHTNKWIGRFAMNVAIQNTKIAPEQYSGLGHSAIDHTLNCRLTFDHHAFHRTPFALSCSDLKSCYDRVVHAAVSLPLQRLGFPVEFILGVLELIQSMVHNICTEFGDSSKTYGGEDIPPEYKHHLQGFKATAQVLLYG